MQDGVYITSVKGRYKIYVFRFTFCHQTARLVMQNNVPHDAFFFQPLTPHDRFV